MADVGSWFKWEDHFLDALLLMWIGWAMLVVFLSNSLTSILGPIQPRISWDRKEASSIHAKVIPGQHGHESCLWLNSALNWLFLHYDNFPQIVDNWVQALNDQAAKLGGPVQLKFERVQSGSLPPKFSEVTFDSGPEDKYDVHAVVDSRDLSLAVFASQQTHEGVRLCNLTVSILKLRGMLKVHCFRKEHDMMAEIAFEGRPDIKVAGKPVNPYQDPADLVDIGVTEEIIRNTVCLASTTINLSKWIKGSDIPFGQPAPVSPDSTQTVSSPRLLQQTIQQAPPSPRLQQQQQQQVFEPIEAKEYQSAFQAPSQLRAPPAKTAKPNRSQNVPEDKRLLVKVIKASGLNNKGQAIIDPYCVVYVDTPPQSELTSVVRSTLNPFWDEQFFFNMSSQSQELRFEVLDKRATAGENFLGEAVVYCEDLRRNPSSRQIIPLQGRPGVSETVSGSLTVEFLCMDPVESDSYDASTNQVSSPWRTIETSKAVNSGGTVITTTTTTTQKPQNSRADPGIDGSPSYIEKRAFDYNTAGSPSSERYLQTTIPTIDSSPTEETNSSLTSSSPEQLPPVVTPLVKEKKKSFASQIKKRFSRSKKRSHSMDRASGSLHDGSKYLRPPDQAYGPQSKDDLELVRSQEHPEGSSLKKSRSLGSSLKKLFRRGRRSRSRGKGENSRESSVSRGSSLRHVSQGPSRENSLPRSPQTQSEQETLVL
ncbi:hypothetical protein ACJMK2_025826 [Sinanodonta woodiana]|uniref:C2 domain-containing protein n=1 Tax=Sinanodonta woodiana TaxID=1069815 RepID=A0ABD3XLA4_SINWO